MLMCSSSTLCSSYGTQKKYNNNLSLSAYFGVFDVSIANAFHFAVLALIVFFFVLLNISHSPSVSYCKRFRVCLRAFPSAISHFWRACVRRCIKSNEPQSNCLILRQWLNLIIFFFFVRNLFSFRRRHLFLSIMYNFLWANAFIPIIKLSGSYTSVAQYFAYGHFSPKLERWTANLFSTVIRINSDDRDWESKCVGERRRER